MYYRWYFVLLLLMISCSSQFSKSVELKVLQFNIWQEGTVVEGGFDAIVNEIERSDADLIALSEVRNYKDLLFSERVLKALERKGLHYYSYPSYDTGILSKHPIVAYSMLYIVENDHGSITKAIIDIHSIEVAFYSGHLDYLNCALYLPRGYDGSTWEKLPEIVTDMEKIDKVDKASKRDEQIKTFIADALKEIKNGRIVIYGGDNNEPSFLDWTAATKDMFDHNGLIIPWGNSVSLDESGFKDAYRQLYPNPKTHPGFTFPDNNIDISLEKLVWSPDADDRDRIDYIYYHPDQRLKLKDIALIGSRGSIVKNKRVAEDFQDNLIEPLDIWPSDHRAVLATFQLHIK